MKKLLTLLLFTILLVSCDTFKCYRCYSTTTTTYEPNIDGYPKVEIEEVQFCDITRDELNRIIEDSTYRIKITLTNECTTDTIIKTITKYLIEK